MSANRLIRIIGVLLACCSFAAAAEGATKAERSQNASELVQQALQLEAYGMDDKRDELLDQALEQDEQCAEAMWHRGYVRFRNRWMTADEVIALNGQDSQQAAYEAARDEAPDTVQGQWELALWCNDRGLLEQEVAHLTRVLQIDPDHAQARERLGFRRFDGNWVSQEDIATSQLRGAALRDSLARWSAKLQKDVQLLADSNEKRRALAADRIRAIDDPAAIPALERMVSSAGPEAALLVVEAVRKMSGHEASLSLARHAVFSPYREVRDEAAAELKHRKLQTFVPELLANMYSPVTSKLDVFRGETGRLMYRHSFIREGQDHREHMVMDTEYRRIAMPGQSADNALERAVLNMALTARAREVAVAQQNILTEALNQRIASTLNAVTDQELPASAEQWWDWWTQENEVYVAGLKPTRSTYSNQERTIVDPIPTSLGSETMDCLSAGTLVWTAAGPKAIEKVKIGDLVLAQHPNTGELAYKPVLRTTVRPPSDLVKVRIGGETIETSGGHLFWVAGEGWVKARKLQDGAVLHGVDGVLHVSCLERGSQQPTYNLIVDDFHTYFVGESRVLSHDNTVQRVTSAVVPGLVQ